MAIINLERLSDYPIVAPDTETTGLRWAHGDKMFGIAIAAWDGQQIVSGYWDIRNHPRVVEALNRQLPLVKKLVNHNAKFDSHFMQKAGIKVPIERFECTSVRAALINEHEPAFSLDALGHKYLKRGKYVGVYEELAAMFGGLPTRDAQMKNLHRAPESLAGKYATPDAEIALLLWQWQEKEIERQGLQKIWTLERALTPVLTEIEAFGIRVDEEEAYNQSKRLTGIIAEEQMNLNRVAGCEINANSPKQMRELFGVWSKGTGIYMIDENGQNTEIIEWFTGGSNIKLISTDAGNPSLDADALELLENFGDARAKQVQTLRKYTKAKQFFNNHILGHAVNGRLYPNYNQTKNEYAGVGPGRLSITDPALQQIPARDRDIARIVRPCFLPEEGHEWACSDWKQFEFRWFAHYTKDPMILRTYEQDPNTDYHAIVSTITGIPRDAPHAGAANSKQINLGLVFGMGEGEMAYQMGLDYTTRRDERGREWKNAGPEAKSVFSTYHGAIPGVRKLLDQASSIARSRGYVKTAMDRHIRFPGGKFTHKAAGLVFQGTSADCLKLKMIALHNMGKKEGFNYLLSVHDENNTSIPKGSVKKIVPLIKAELEAFGEGDPITCRVPIRCSIKVGPNWAVSVKD